LSRQEVMTSGDERKLMQELRGYPFATGKMVQK
jgi:hypothetical protein